MNTQTDLKLAFFGFSLAVFSSQDGVKNMVNL